VTVGSFIARLLGGSGGAAEAGWVEADALQQRLAGEMPPLLIDVREPAEFGSPPGHLPGAVNMPLGTIGGRVAELAREKRPIVLVCHSDRRASVAAARLRAGGLAGVEVLRGGTAGWHRRGLPMA
jgi:rhodanese-related sulfurtransferase